MQSGASRPKRYSDSPAASTASGWNEASERRLIDLAVPLLRSDWPTIGRPGNHNPPPAGSLSIVLPSTLMAHRVESLPGQNSIQRSDSAQQRSWVHDGLLSER